MLYSSRLPAEVLTALNIKIYFKIDQNLEQHEKNAPEASFLTLIFSKPRLQPSVRSDYSSLIPSKFVLKT